MKVSIRNIDALSEEQVVIECVSVTPEIEEIRAFAQAKGHACTEKKVYEIRQRLYEIEKAYGNYNFVRCSKSVVLNLMKLGNISPALAGRYTAHMQNGEKLIISRKYAPDVIGRVMNWKG